MKYLAFLFLLNLLGYHSPKTISTQIKIKVDLSENAQKVMEIDGIEGQKITLLLLTKKLNKSKDEGVEIRIKANSLYKKQKVKHKIHKFLFGKASHEIVIPFRHIFPKEGDIQDVLLIMEIDFKG